MVRRDLLAAAHRDNQLAVHAAVGSPALEHDVLKAQLVLLKGGLERRRGDHLQIAAALQQLADHVLIALGHAFGDGLQQGLALLRKLLLPDLLDGGQRHLLDLGLRHAGQVANHVELPAPGADGDGGALLAGASGAADAVDVVLVVAGHVVVDDVIDVVDVDAARGHVGGHQQRDAGGLERVHHAGALGLVQVAVQRLGGDAVAHEVLGDLLHHRLGVAEDHAQLGLVGAQQQVQRVQLAAHGHVHVDLADVLQRHLLAVDLDHVGLGEVGLRQLQDGIGHGGGEEHRLAGLRHVLQDRLDVLAEAHGEHLVGLVQHHQLHVRQRQRAPAHVIHHAARRADHQVALPQVGDLPVHGRAAVHVRDPHALHEAGELLDLVRALLGQLAGGAEDEHLHAGLGLAAVDLFDGGDGEGQGLAGAGLGLADHVAALAHGGNGLGLDVGGGFKAELVDGALHLRQQAKLGKFHFTHGNSFLPLSLYPCHDSASAAVQLSAGG